jgi:trehalose-6-phosphatase
VTKQEGTMDRQRASLSTVIKIKESYVLIHYINMENQEAVENVSICMVRIARIINLKLYYFMKYFCA